MSLQDFIDWDIDKWEKRLSKTNESLNTTNNNDVNETISKQKISFAYHHRILKLAKKINTDPTFSKANVLKELEAALGPL